MVLRLFYPRTTSYVITWVGNVVLGQGPCRCRSITYTCSISNLSRNPTRLQEPGSKGTATRKAIKAETPGLIDQSRSWYVTFQPRTDSPFWILPNQRKFMIRPERGRRLSQCRRRDSHRKAKILNSPIAIPADSATKSTKGSALQHRIMTSPAIEKICKCRN